MMKTILVWLMASALLFSAGSKDRVTFVDKNVEKCALKAGDRNGDGVLTLAVGCSPKLITPNREGELLVRRKYSDNDPDSIWYR